jgi:uncharacterized membrane protein
MKRQQPLTISAASKDLQVMQPKKQIAGLQEIEEALQKEHKSTFGQRVADKMAARVGSWAFLIGQSAILTGWVGMNLMPGVPHWDQSPFIMLNLVFSFASAYTAPIVLMSQNRQSDVDREKSEYDRQVNLKSGYDIEQLHQKMDVLQAQQLKELMVVVQTQQQALTAIQASIVPVLQAQQQAASASTLPGLTQQRSLNEVKVPENGYSVYFPGNVNQPDIGNSVKDAVG